MHASSARSTFIMNEDTARNDMEYMIVNAQSEDEVTEIMKLYDEHRRAAEDHLIASLATASPPMRDAAVIRSKAAAVAKMSPEPLDGLESLIVNAQSEDEVAEIMKIYDEHRRAAEDHLIASLATASPPMRDAAVIRSKAAAVASKREERTADPEACIIDAKSEDELQPYMQMRAPHSEPVVSLLRPSIRIDVDTASCYDLEIEDEVQPCVQMHAPRLETGDSLSRPNIRIDVDTASCYDD